ncbi:acyl-CoA N-acyltransferase [Xylariaceae sp. FL0255]|nr:acyl-CoA N-acyltransferase [Xylariaceae sp. FL0255]
MSSADVTFCLPIKRLENERMILEPFDISSHLDAYLDGCKDHPELHNYVGYGPIVTKADFAAFYEPRMAKSSSDTLFAIMAKSDETDERGTLAGVIGYQNASATNGTLEIGYITVLPKFHRTFVTSNAVGLLLLYAMDAVPGGLGMRRCQWQSHASNEASRRVATRMHFTFECVQRFQRTVPIGKVGNGFDTSGLADATGRNLGPSRDSAVFAHYCDEWPEKRKGVVAVMERR